jgi:hypothetical protein
MRNITGLQDNIYMGEVRSPITKVYLYDQTDSLSDIVLQRATQIPVDLSKYVQNISLEEQAESATTASLKLVTPKTDTFSPYIFCGRKIIKITYTDEKIQERGEAPINVFIGPVVGQPGFRFSRDGNYDIDIKCEDRSHFYKKRNIESPKFSQDEDLGDVAVEMAMNTAYGLNLEREEIKFGLLWSAVAHTEVSFFDIKMMEALQLIGFMVDKLPGFDGDGYLRFYDASISKAPARSYQDMSLFVDISWPQSETEAVNRVRVVGLSNVLSKIVSDFQELVTLTGTIGYFQEGFKKEVRFSEDGNGRAENVLITTKKFDGQLGKIFGGTSVKLKNITEFGTTIQIKTPYMAWIFIAFFLVYIAFFIVSLIFFFLSPAIHIAAAIWLTVGLALMQQLGTFEVRVSGNPYKMVYKEVEGIAEWANLLPYEINEKTIENHLVYSQDLADAFALRELKRETVKICERSFTMPHDPALECHDIIELADGSRFYITGISKSFSREDTSSMSINTFMVRSGKEYNDLPGFPTV